VTWGKRKQMADGKFSMAYKQFLGYEKGSDGTPQIVESEAKIVRRIYNMFLAGKAIREICVILTNDKIPTPRGKTVWHKSTVKSILTNEKYTGNAILQKRYTVDFLTKTTKVNEGEVPQYYVKNSHPAIVDQITFELVQAEMTRRENLGKQFSGNGLFFCKIVCGECDGFYGSKVWHTKDKYRRMIWQCNRKYAEKLHCPTPHLTEEQIQSCFVTAFNLLWEDKDRYLAEYAAATQRLTNTTRQDQRMAVLQDECDQTLATIQSCIKENAYTARDQDEYARRYDELAEKYKAAKAQIDKLSAKKQAKLVQAEKIRRFSGILRKTENPIIIFDSRLWCAAVESVTVHSKEKVVVTFQSGTKIQVAVT